MGTGNVNRDTFIDFLKEIPEFEQELEVNKFFTDEAHEKFQRIKMFHARHTPRNSKPEKRKTPGTQSVRNSKRQERKSS
jgi:hypothetical protein